MYLCGMWYFELKEIKTLRAQEKLLPIPPHSTLNYLEEFELGALPIIKDYQK